jgi:hypothetical protein
MKFVHREQPLPAGRASWSNDSVPTLRDGGRTIDKRVKGVTANLSLKRSQQLYFLHLTIPVGVSIELRARRTP